VRSTTSLSVLDVITKVPKSESLINHRNLLLPVLEAGKSKIKML
jgi:hypothetical protein